MSWQLARIALALVVPPLVGAVALRALGFRWRSDRLAFAGWAWVIGAFLIALLTLVWFALGKPIPGTWLAPAVAVASTAALCACRRTGAAAAPRRGGAPLERLLLRATGGALLALVSITALASTTVPAIWGDEAGIWAAKAKTLYDSRGWADLHVDLELRVFHPDYPMLNPLLQTWTFAAGGEILEFHGRLPVQACTFALLCILAALLRRMLRPGVAAVILLLFFTQRVVLRELDRGNADLMVALGVIASLDGWLRVRGGDARCWPLACAGLAFLAWSKNEGIALALMLATWFVLDRRRLAHGRDLPLRWLALPALAVAVTAAFAVGLGVTNDIVAWDRPGQFFERLLGRAEHGAIVAQALAEEVARFESRWLVLLFLALMLVIPRRLAPSAAKPIALITCAALALYLVVFVATPLDLRWHLGTAADRLVFQVSALATVGLAVALPLLWPRLANEGAAAERAVLPR